MSVGLNRFAILVACATFFLIIAGALVSSNDAGLATEDWPLSNGQVFPKMVGNLFWEHGHRMVATSVGILTIVLTVSLFMKEKRSWVRRLGLFALIAVIAQGLLGGLTVKLMLFRLLTQPSPSCSFALRSAWLSLLRAAGPTKASGWKRRGQCPLGICVRQR